MKQSLGCLSTTGIITAVMALLVIIGFILFGGGAVFSPGPLNAQHGTEVLGGAVAHIDLSHNCGRCHSPFWGPETMSDRCLMCHTGITLELQSATSLHSVLMQNASRPCQDCHTEHNGPTASLTLITHDRFPHADATGFSLQAHQVTANEAPFACADCHPQDLSHFDQNTCDMCHRDIDLAFTRTHSDTFGRDCLACHDGLDTYGAAFDHNQLAFPLEGAHTAVDCAGCHRGMHTPTDLQATDQTCYACHRQNDAHRGQFGQNCAVCHTSAGWEPVAFDHALTNFPLVGAHNQMKECTACHPDNRFENTPQECYACHRQDDAHNGEFGSDCAACHTPENWQEATFDHALTMFPLMGAHTHVACEACHIDNVFAGTPQECSACHVEPDYHLGLFSSACEECHLEDAWSPARYTQTHTFPLDHGRRGQSLVCADCHPTGLQTYSCYEGCHEHTPANIEGEHREEGIRDLQDCIACHPTGREGEGERGGSREGGDD